MGERQLVIHLKEADKNTAREKHNDKYTAYCWLGALTLLLGAHQSTASAHHTANKMNDVADKLKTDLSGEPVTVKHHGSVTLTSGADVMFTSGGWELKPGVPLLSKIAPALAKLQHTEIVVSGYTDDTPIGAPAAE